MGNAALRYSGVNGRSYLLDMNILMGLGKGDSVDKSEDLRGKKTSFFFLPKFQRKQQGRKSKNFLLKGKFFKPVISATRVEISF